MEDIIVAIDGHSSCGKSTIAKKLAEQLGYIYIDTGAMYRTVALYCMRKRFINGEQVDVDAVVNHLPQIHIVFKYNPQLDATETYLNDENVEQEIRGVEVSQQVTKISQIKAVRDRLIGLQREMGKAKRVVMDGRDIGTVVFPEAALKLYVTANIDIRAKRRYKQMIKSGRTVSYEEVKRNLEQRDYDDIHKGERPLRKADDAIEINTSYLSLAEQSQLALNYVKDVTK
jgi:cytidylate kinase